MKISSGSAASGIMQTHLLTMLLLLVHIVQEAMARHVPVLVLLNARYRPPVTIMSVENKNIQYAYNMMKMNIEDHIIVLSFCTVLAVFL